MPGKRAAYDRKRDVGYERDDEAVWNAAALASALALAALCAAGCVPEHKKK